MVERKTSEARKQADGVDLAGAEYSTFTLEAAEDDRILRSSLWLAAGFHILLLMINLPAFNDPLKATEKKDEKVFIVQNARFEPKPVPPTAIPQKRVKKMPAPDPTPDEPEPLRLYDPQPEVDLPEVDVDFLIPEAPPAPEPKGPRRVGGDVSKPEKLYAPQPRYTEIARKARIQGTVVVESIIDQQGNVVDVKLLKGLPMGLSEEAVKAIKNWKFKSATLGGKPVSVYFTLTVRFALQ